MLRTVCNRYLLLISLHVVEGNLHQVGEMLLTYPSCSQAKDELGRTALSIACCMVCNQSLDNTLFTKWCSRQ